MLAVLGGLGAAAAWSISTLCSSRSSRMMEPMAVVALVMVVGLVITAPIAAAHGVDDLLVLDAGGQRLLHGGRLPRAMLSLVRFRWGSP